MGNHIFMPTDAALKDTVQLFWQTEQYNSFQCETIIPKGTIEIIFNFCNNSNYTARLNHQEIQIPRCFILGFTTTPVQLQLPWKQSCFGVLLKPSSVQPIFGFPAGELINQFIDMTLVDASMLSLWHHLAEQTSFNRRVQITSDWLKLRSPHLTDREVAFNNYLNMASDKLLSVSEMADWLCYSHRHLSRKLQQLTGMNTEQTLLYKKHIRSAFLMHHSNLALTEISYACDFADQSHFIKTFKSFAALTPGDYKKRKSQIIGHFFDNVR